MVVTQSAYAKSKGQDDLDRGSRLYREGRFLESAQAFKDATKLDPALIKAWENLARAYQKSGQIKETQRIFATLLKIEPGNLEIQNALGFLFMEENQWHRAIPHLNTSLQLDPDQIRVRLRLAKANLKTGQTDRGIDLFRQALQMQPDNREALLNLALAYENSGRRALAISVYKKHLSLVSNIYKADEKNEISGKLSVLLIRQGDKHYRKGWFQKAEATYKQALNWSRDNRTLYKNLGWSLEKQGKYNEAVNYWKKVLIDDDAGLAHQIANAYFHSGQINEAQEWYRETARRDPTLQSVQYHLFEYALEDNKIPEALEAVRHVFAPPGADKVWSMRAVNNFIRTGNLDPGAEFFLERLSPSRQSQTTKKVLGRLYSKMGSRDRETGDVQKAILNYEKALLHDEFNAPAYRDLGWLYLQSEKPVESERVWRKYQKTFPDKAQPHDLLARVFMNRGSFEKALAELKESLAIDPDRPQQKLLQTKALYWDNRFRDAMQNVNRLVREYPDRLPVQYFYGEVLMRQQDFLKGKTQWRKVLDMGAKSPRAYFYWVQSLYETGEYESAVHEAIKFLDQHPPYKPMVKLLFHSALFRHNKERAIFWYEILLENFGDHPGDWLELAKLYTKINRKTKAIDRLNAAEKKFPKNVEVQVAVGDWNLKEGNYEKSLAIFKQISRMNPDNRRAFIGTFHALKAAGRLQEAIRHLRSNQQIFLKSYEVDLQLGDMKVAMKDFDAAYYFYSKVAKPRKPGQYVPILLYHGLSGHSRSRNLWARHFDEQLKALAEAGYTTLTVAELGDIMDEKRTLPEKPILITFDDSRRDAFHFGDPVLKKYGMKATMFVPTARIHEDGPFFSDWNRTREYAESGRWDIQAHGHQAHDLILIDSKGAKGNFLTNFVWLHKKNRQETINDFYARLDVDYRKNINQLETQIPGLSVVGYAYPFSEAGQSRRGNVESARAVNHALLEKHFKFGFIQDQTGYNWVDPGESRTSLLRRFSVPRDWDGERLVQHLAEKHPSHRAKLALAKSQFWSGQYSEAGEVFSNLISREPRLKNKVQIYLADISFQGGNYWETKNLLRDISLKESLLNPKVETLEEAVAWKTRPRIVGGFDFFNDSNDRTNHSETVKVYFPLKSPLELLLEGGFLEFKEKGRADIDGGQVSTGFDWRGWKAFRLRGKFRNRTFSKTDHSQSYWASAEYLKNQYKVLFDWSDRDIDTVQAIENGIQVKNYGLKYQARFSWPFLGTVGVSYQDYDDGNSAIGITTRLRYGLPDLKNWRIGADLSYKDSEFETPAFYTPDQLLIGSARIYYQRTFAEKLNLQANFGLGGASDKVNGVRWVTSGGVNLGYRLTRQLKAGLDTNFSVVPGYNRVNLRAFIGYRF